MRRIACWLLLCIVGATASLHAEGRSEQAMTLWAVIFNRPELCSGGVCDGNDFEHPAIPEIAVVYLGGTRVQPNGNATFAGAFAEGQTFGALPLPALTVHDVDTAEIHLVVRSHGTFVPGMADDQVTTFDGGCVEECRDLQFAVFRAQDADASGRQTATVHHFADATVVAGAWASLRREGDGFRTALHTKLR